MPASASSSSVAPASSAATSPTACSAPGGAAGVTLYDNFSSGREWHYAHHDADPRFRVVRGDVEDLRALRGRDGRPRRRHPPGVEPRHRARRARADHRLHAGHGRSPARWSRRCAPPAPSGSSTPRAAASTATSARSRRREDHGPLIPVSTYGASKLAGEALIASYAYMFGLSGCAFRFGNVVGPAPDPRRRLRLRAPAARLEAAARPDHAAHPRRRQPEQVLHPRDRHRARRADRAREDDRAVRAPTTWPPATTSRSPRSPSWPSSAWACRAERVRFDYTGGDRGWKGDVPDRPARHRPHPRARLALRARRSREALRQSMLAMIPDMKAGRM